MGWADAPVIEEPSAQDVPVWVQAPLVDAEEELGPPEVDQPRQPIRPTPEQPPQPEPEPPAEQLSEQPSRRVRYNDNKVAVFPHDTPDARIERTLGKVTANQRELKPEQAGGRSLWIDSGKHTELRKSTPLNEEGIAGYAEEMELKPEQVSPPMLAEYIKIRKAEAEEVAQHEDIDLVALREFNEDTAAMERDLERGIWPNETTLEYWRRMAVAKGTDPALAKPIASAAKRDKAVRDTRPEVRARKNQPWKARWAESLLREYHQKYGSEVPVDREYFFNQANKTYKAWLEKHPKGASEAFDQWRRSNPIRSLLHEEEKRLAKSGNRSNDWKSISEAMISQHASKSDLGWVPYSLKRVPLGGAAVMAVELWQVRNAVKRIDKRKGTGDDFFIIAKALDQAEKGKDRSFGKKTWDLVSSLPATGIEFILTGGVFTAARAGTAKLGTTVLKRVVQNRVAKTLIKTTAGRIVVGVAAKAIPVAVGIGAQTTVNVPLVARKVAEKWMPEYGLTQNEVGQLTAVITGDDPSFLEALSKGYGAAYIEMGSERAGVAVGKLGGALAKSKVGRALAKMSIAKRTTALKAALVNRFLARGGTVAQADKILRKAGWNGMIGEVFEERVADIAGGITGIEKDFGTVGKLLTNDPEGWEQLGIEALAFSVIPVGMTSLRAADAVMTPQEQRDVARLQGLRGKVEAGGKVSREDARVFTAEIGIKLPKDRGERTEIVRGIFEAIKEVEDAEAAVETQPEPATAGAAETEAVAGQVSSEAAEPEAVPSEPAVGEREGPAVEEEEALPRPETELQPPPEVGQYVQWTSGGVDQFSRPREVTGISKDGSTVFIEGATTGIPISETKVVGEAESLAAAEDRKIEELKLRAKQEVQKWQRRTRKSGGRAADATFAEIQREVNRALKLLGLKAADNLSPEGIKKAFLDAARQAHPDRGGSTAEMAKLNMANDLLTNSPATLELAKRKWEREQQPAKPQPAVSEVPVETPTKPTEAPPAKPTPKLAPPAAKPTEAAREPETAKPDYSGMTVEQLTVEAKRQGLKRYSGKKKAALRAMLEDADRKVVEAEPVAPEGEETGRTEGDQAEFGQEPSPGGAPGVLSVGLDLATNLPISVPRGGVGRSVRSFFRKFFTAPGELSAEVYDAKVRKEGRTAKEMNKLRFAATDFRRTIRKALGGRELTEATVKNMNAVLRGEADMTTVPPEMRSPLQAMRDHIDSLSRQLIAEGVAQGDLVGIITKNLGVYATRSYRVFDDPKWRDKVPDGVRNRAIAAIREMYPDKSDAEIQGIFESLLFRGAADSPASLLKGSKLGSKDLGIFMRRKEVPEWLRDLWGEYKDAGVNYARSVFKMAHLLANQQFLNEVREAGLGKWLRTEEDGPIVNEYGEVITPIAAESSSVMAPLNGLYTTPEIKAAFEKFDSARDVPDWLRVYFALNYGVKYSKTVGSAMTHIRNLISNLGFAVANGHWRLNKAGKAIWATATGTWQLSGKEWRTYYERLAELGLVGEDVRAGELKDALRDASKVDIDEYLYNRDARHASKIARAGRAAVRFTNALYQAEDGVWKIFAWENEKARYAKAHPEWSQQQVEEHTAKIVRDTFPTYSKVGAGVKAIRRFPLVGTFVNFPAEVVRTTFHTIRIGLQEMQEPATRTIGAQRLVGTTIALGGLSVLTSGIMAAMGIGDDEDEDLRWFVPPWQENSRFLYLSKDAGKYRYVDLGYSDPHAWLTDSVVAFMRGEDWKESLTKSTAEFLDPFASEEIFAKTLMEVRGNATDTGRRVYNPEDSAGDQASDVVKHVWSNAFEPGTITSLRRIAKGATGTVSETGRSYNPVVETTSMLTGQRLQEVDVEQSLAFRIRDFAKAMSDIQAIARKTATSRGTVSGEQVTADRAKMEKLRLARHSEMQRILGAAKRLGVPSRNIERLLIDGLSDDMAKELIEGDYTPYEMTPEMVQRMLQSSPQQFRKRFAAWHGDELPEAVKTFARPLIGSIPAKPPSEEDKTAFEYRAAIDKHQEKLQTTKTTLDALGVSYKEAEQLLLWHYAYEAGKNGKPKLLNGKPAGHYDYATSRKGDTKETFRARRDALKSLYDAK